MAYIISFIQTGLDYDCKIFKCYQQYNKGYLMLDQKRKVDYGLQITIDGISDTCKNDLSNIPNNNKTVSTIIDQIGAEIKAVLLECASLGGSFQICKGLTSAEISVSDFNKGVLSELYDRIIIYRKYDM